MNGVKFFCFSSLSALACTGSVCASASEAVRPDLLAALHPAVHTAVLAALPEGLRTMGPAQRQLQVQLSAPRGAAAQACAQPWRIGPIKVQQLARMTVPIECSGVRGSVVARVQLHAPAPVLAVDAPAGHRLRTQDIRMQPSAITQPAQWLGSASLHGQALRQDLPAGTQLQARDIERPVLLRRGDRVEIQAFGGGVQVRVDGIATGTGRLGEEVSVRNARTQQLVKGRLIGPGVVEAAAQPLLGSATVKVLQESSD